MKPIRYKVYEFATPEMCDILVSKQFYFLVDDKIWDKLTYHIWDQVKLPIENELYEFN